MEEFYPPYCGKIAVQSSPESRDFFRSTLNFLSIARIVIAIILFVFWGILKHTPTINILGFSFFGVTLAYLIIAIFFALFIFKKHSHLFAELFLQLVVDSAIMACLYLMTGGMTGGMIVILFFPLASAAILTSMMSALFFAAGAAIFVVLETFILAIGSNTINLLTQAGLYGGTFLVAVYFINKMAGRLINQEKLVVQRAQDLQIQQTINRLIVADMNDGILVIGEENKIAVANETAENLLALSKKNISEKLEDIPHLYFLHEIFTKWKKNGAKEISIIHTFNEDATYSDGAQGFHSIPIGTRLRLRIVPATLGLLSQKRTLIFIQDLTNIEDQAQQLKLASMGQLTASVAHEIRNPLSAISHSAALLQEDAKTNVEKRLLQIITDNVERLNRMVEDILSLSRKAQSRDWISLNEFIADLKSSFDSENNLPDNILVVRNIENYRIFFDQLHLREILQNLLNNALRYSSGQPGCIQIFAVQSIKNRLELHVKNDGDPIPPEIREHLFEPFFTTSSKGTGLGLYLARELCLNNNARLYYEIRSDQETPSQPQGRFVINFDLTETNEQELSA